MKVNQITKILTIIVGSLSLISFITKIFDIGLIASLNLYVIYYQNIMYPIIGFPFDIFNMTIPLILYDFWTLSFYALQHISMQIILKSQSSIIKDMLILGYQFMLR